MSFFQTRQRIFSGRFSPAPDHLLGEQVPDPGHQPGQQLRRRKTRIEIELHLGQIRLKVFLSSFSKVRLLRNISVLPTGSLTFKKHLGFGGTAVVALWLSKRLVIIILWV